MGAGREGGGGGMGPVLPGDGRRGPPPLPASPDYRTPVRDFGPATYVSPSQPLSSRTGEPLAAPADLRSLTPVVNRPAAGTAAGAYSAMRHVIHPGGRSETVGQAIAVIGEIRPENLRHDLPGRIELFASLINGGGVAAPGVPGVSVSARPALQGQLAEVRRLMTDTGDPARNQENHNQARTIMLTMGGAIQADYARQLTTTGMAAVHELLGSPTVGNLTQARAILSEIVGTDESPGTFQLMGGDADTRGRLAADMNAIRPIMTALVARPINAINVENTGGLLNNVFNRVNAKLEVSLVSGSAGAAVDVRLPVPLGPGGSRTPPETNFQALINPRDPGRAALSILISPTGGQPARMTAAADLIQGVINNMPAGPERERHAASLTAARGQIAVNPFVAQTQLTLISRGLATELGTGLAVSHLTAATPNINRARTNPGEAGAALGSARMDLAWAASRLDHLIAAAPPHEQGPLRTSLNRALENLGVTVDARGGWRVNATDVDDRSAATRITAYATARDQLTTLAGQLNLNYGRR